MRRIARDRNGFTLVEIILALSIVGALLVVAFGGLRVAVSAWRRGDERAEIHQHHRSLTVTLSRAMSAAYPYRAGRAQGESPVLLFKGDANRLEFVTQASPFPTPTPVAFTAVVIELHGDDRPALIIRQRVLPNYDPFTAATPVLEDDRVRALELSYLGDNGWQSAWDAQQDGGLPRAIRIGLGATGAPDGNMRSGITVAVGGSKR